MIDAEQVSVSYGLSMALTAVDLTAKSGVTLGLIGPNGSGKSTLLRAILGAVRISGGRVAVDEQALSSLGARQRAERVAVVAQEEPTGFPLSVWDSVLLGRSARLPGWSGYRASDEDAAAEAMERAGITHLAGRLIDELSGGERQRVLIARALAQQASHLLLDEPTNHLDVRYQHEICHLVHGLDLTAIMVLHDLNLAARYCDELVLLHEGAVVAHGAPEEVLTADILRPVYGMAIRRVNVGGVMQLVFMPLAS